MEFKIKEKYELSDVPQIMKKLRSEEGCMWDREQTHSSIRKNLIEETYEVVEAIDTEDLKSLCEELGDVLLQIVFHAEIENEKGVFGIDDVADALCKKLVFRHPHVFGKTKVSDSAEVLVNWDKLKTKEKGHRSPGEEMKNVAVSLPSLVRAGKLQSKAAKAGFDFESVADVVGKIREETDEVWVEIETGACVCEEVGDLLFSCVNLARFLNVDAEEALYRSNEKFLDRFLFLEQEVAKKGCKINDLTTDELESIWKTKKTLEK